MIIKRELQGQTYEIKLSSLYKTREDNSLTTNELVKKYESRIINKTI